MHWVACIGASRQPQEKSSWRTELEEDGDEKMGPKHSGDDLAVPWRKPEDDVKMDGGTLQM